MQPLVHGRLETLTNMQRSQSSCKVHRPIADKQTKTGLQLPLITNTDWISKSVLSTVASQDMHVDRCDKTELNQSVKFKWYLLTSTRLNTGFCFNTL
jgi:hypothetical protein